MDRSVHGSAWLDSETFVLAVDPLRDSTGVITQQQKGDVETRSACPREFSDRMYQSLPRGDTPGREALPPCPADA
jgi:hypothetical protein